MASQSFVKEEDITDAETVVNYNVSKKSSNKRSNSINNIPSSSWMEEINKKTILEEDLNLSSDEDDSNDDKHIKETQPHSSTTFKQPKQGVSKGIKRALEETENSDEELKVVELYTEDFNYLQNIHLTSELLPLIQSNLSHASNLNNDEIRDFNCMASRLLIHIAKEKGRDQRIETNIKIIQSIKNANSVK